MWRILKVTSPPDISTLPEKYRVPAIGDVKGILEGDSREHLDSIVFVVPERRAVQFYDRAAGRIIHSVTGLDTVNWCQLFQTGEDGVFLVKGSETPIRYMLRVLEMEGSETRFCKLDIPLIVREMNMVVLECHVRNMMISGEKVSARLQSSDGLLHIADGTVERVRLRNRMPRYTMTVSETGFSVPDRHLSTIVRDVVRLAVD